MCRLFAIKAFVCINCHKSTMHLKHIAPFRWVEERDKKLSSEIATWAVIAPTTIIIHLIIFQPILCLAKYSCTIGFEP